MENLLKNIEELRERLAATRRLLDIDGKKSEVRNQKLEAGSGVARTNHVPVCFEQGLFVRA